MDRDVAKPRPDRALPEESFATEAHELLKSGQDSPARTQRLGAVVRKQLEHAGVLFAHGEDVRGAQAVLGAFQLLRGGELAGLKLTSESLPALDGAIRRFSARGDEGRTLALLGLKRGLVLKGSREERELESHLDALRRWAISTKGGGVMQQRSAEQKQAVARAFLEPSDDALAAAASAVSKWIERAVEINVAFQETRTMPDREDALEAFRALQTGAYVMAALYLRQGRAAESLQAIEASAASRVTQPRFFSKLRAAAREGRAEDWRLLAREFGQVGTDDEAEEGPLDPDVLDAALWGVALEAYRIDPKSLAVAHLLANQLVEHELPEVAPLVLADALGREPAAASLSGALEIVADALRRDPGDGEIASARRVFDASTGLLALASAPPYQGQLQTSAAELRQLMGALELRAGNAQAARARMIESLRAEPTSWGLTSLAALERQLGETSAAAATAERAYRLASAGVPQLDAANARLLSFELARDAGREDSARRALDDAFRTVIEVRRRAGKSEVAVRAESMLARVLDAYGERERAERATARALDLADQHRQLLPETMLAAISRAVAQGDLGGARAALGVGIKADADHDSLVYGALWVSSLERMLGEASDGKVDRVFADAVNGDTWTSKLARWARGSLSDDDLSKAARNHSDRVEAEFYLALRAKASHAGDSIERLTRVATNPLVDLFEVRLARDLVSRQLHLPLPSDATLP